MCCVAGKEVKLWNDDLWRTIRERDGISSDFLADPAYVGPFKNGGGKGGDLMAFTVDGGYIIKELGKGDHACLAGITGSFVERIKGGQTLLVTIYLHFTDPSQDKAYMVMRNLLKHKGPFVGLYDLKGCADDKTLEANGRKVHTVHKRVWHVHMWCGDCAWSDDRMTYFQGKVAARAIEILVTKRQRADVVSRLRLDTDWLSENNLMDYSLLVGVKRISQAEFALDKVARWSHSAPIGELRQPLLSRAGLQSRGPDGKDVGDVTLVYVGIIDFLQAWTLGKKIAMGLKVLERNKATIPPLDYSHRFFTHFEQAIQGTAEPLAKTVEEENGNNRVPVQALTDFPEEPTQSVHAYYSCTSMAPPAETPRRTSMVPGPHSSRQIGSGCASCFPFVVFGPR